MKPAIRESVRAFLNETRTPDDAPARRLLERTSLVHDLDHRLRVDDCEQCGAIHWRDCVCDPSAPRRAPTPDQVEQARVLRLMRTELEPELYSGCDCTGTDGR